MASDYSVQLVSFVCLFASSFSLFSRLVIHAYARASLCIRHAGSHCIMATDFKNEPAVKFDGTCRFQRPVQSLSAELGSFEQSFVAGCKPEFFELFLTS